MIKVRFDRKSPSRLGVVWREPDPSQDLVTESRAASLLFSILNGNRSPGAASKGDDAAARGASKRRRNAGADAGPQAVKPQTGKPQTGKPPAAGTTSIDPVEA